MDSLYGRHRGLAAVLLVAVVVVVALVLSRRPSPRGNTLVIPHQAHVTQAPGGVTLSLPPDMSTVSLAYYLNQHDNSLSGRALYGPAFVRAFTSDNKVPVPTAATDTDTLLRQCQQAYGQDGTTVAEAAITAFFPGTSKDLLA